MIEIINGYPTTTSAEVSLARRGLNPENPVDDPAKADAIESRAGRAVMPAVVFDGMLTPLDRAAQPEPQLTRSGDQAAPAWRIFDITV